MRGGEDWQPGDLAECVKRGEWRPYHGGEPGTGPEVGEIRIVESVVHFAETKVGPLTTLTFARYRPWKYQASSFRKITPRADALEKADGMLRAASCRVRRAMPARPLEAA